MHIVGKLLIGISILAGVFVSGFLCIELVAGINALANGIALTTAQIGGFVGIGVALGVVALTFSIDTILSLWQASKNKENL